MTKGPSLRAETIARALGALGLALVLGALGFQYIIHLAPCEMCHWQRWPLIAAAIIGLVIVPLRKSDARLLAGLVVLLVAISGGIGLYQTGMQYHILPGPETCTAHRFVLGSNAPPPETACDVPTWWFLGLALPAWNAIISLGAALIGTIAWSKSK
jgi:disulfide bond formation protein DsbB